MNLIYIKWTDHCSFGDNSWMSLDEVTDGEPEIVESCGILVKETDDAYYLVLNHTGSDCVYGNILILKSNAIEVIKFNDKDIRNPRSTWSSGSSKARPRQN